MTCPRNCGNIRLMPGMFLGLQLIIDKNGQYIELFGFITRYWLTTIFPGNTWVLFKPFRQYRACDDGLHLHSTKSEFNAVASRELLAITERNCQHDWRKHFGFDQPAMGPPGLFRIYPTAVCFGFVCRAKKPLNLFGPFGGKCSRSLMCTRKCAPCLGWG